MKDEIDKVVDLVTWLDQRIEQRLTQEREYWRSLLVDVMVEERVRVGVLLQKTLDSMVELTHESNGKLLEQVNQGVEQMFDRVEARMRGLDDDGEEPPSKH